MSFVCRLMLVLAIALNCAAASLDTCRALRHRGQLREAQTCFAGLTQANGAFDRAEGYWGLGRYDEANEEFRAALKEQPKSSLVHVEWGRLYLDHYQPGDAAKLFAEAIEMDPTYAPAYLGMAHVATEGYDKKAVEFAHEALQHDPKLTEAHELLAYLALEDNDPKLATEEAQKA